MTKQAKSNKELSSLEKFHNFTKALIAVPRKELQAKLEQHKRRKEKKRLTAP